METKTTIEEKVKTLVLEEIKNLADEAWCNPTDDNICKMFNAVEYLKKVLKNDSIVAPISTWGQSPLVSRDPLRVADDVLMREKLTTFVTGDNNNIARTFDGKL